MITSTEKLPKPPTHLHAAARKLWKDVVANYELEQHDLALLAEACGQLSRVHSARMLVKKHGVCVTDRFGQ